MPPISHLLRVSLYPFTLAFVVAALCYWLTGPSLGLYFGGVIFAAIIVPPIVLLHESWWDRIAAAGSVADAIGIVWLFAVFTSDTTFLQWLAAYVLLLSCIAASMSLALFLRAIRIHDTLAAALTIVVALLWLTWPIWLSPWLGGASGAAIVSWLTPLHPLLALNGLLKHLGIWSQQTIAYRLTNLGQDIAYELPTNVAAAVVLHLLLTTGLLLLHPRPGTAVDIPDRE